MKDLWTVFLVPKNHFNNSMRKQYSSHLFEISRKIISNTLFSLLHMWKERKKLWVRARVAMKCITSLMQRLAQSAVGHYKDDHDDFLQFLKGVQWLEIVTPRVLFTSRVPSSVHLPWTPIGDFIKRINLEDCAFVYFILLALTSTIHLQIHFPGFVTLLPKITVKNVCIQMCQTSLSPLNLLIILKWLFIHLF